MTQQGRICSLAVIASLTSVLGTGCGPAEPEDEITSETSQIHQAILAGSTIGDHLNRGQTLNPGQTIANKFGFYFTFDKGGHAILISPTDEHCASWPDPKSVHSNAHLLYNHAGYIQLISSSGAEYETIGTANSGTTVDISTANNHLYVGFEDIHGC